MRSAGGGFNQFYGIPTLTSASVIAQNIPLFDPREGLLTYQWKFTYKDLCILQLYWYFP